MANQTQPNSHNRKSAPNKSRRNELVESGAQPETSPQEGPTHEQIARRAYELWLQHGQQHGRADEDWLQAERDLRLGRY